MSAAAYHDRVLVRDMLERAVTRFHVARKRPEHADKELLTLARECANGAFQDKVGEIPVQRREIVARKYMDACAAKFAVEVPRALLERDEELEPELVS